MSETTHHSCANPECKHEWNERIPQTMLKHPRQCPICKRSIGRAKKTGHERSFAGMNKMVDDPDYALIMAHLAEIKIKRRRELSKAVGVAPATVWRKTRNLIDAGLVDHEGKGRASRFSIDYVGLWHMLGDYTHVQLRIAKRRLQREPEQCLGELQQHIPDASSREPWAFELSTIDVERAMHDADKARTYLAQFYGSADLQRYSELFWNRIFEHIRVREKHFSKLTTLRDVLESAIYALGSIKTLSPEEQTELKRLEKRVNELHKKSDLHSQARREFLQRIIDEHSADLLPDGLDRPLLAFIVLCEEVIRMRRFHEHSLMALDAVHNSLRRFKNSS